MFAPSFFLLCVLLVNTAFAEHPSYITIASGRRLPYSSLRTHFGKVSRDVMYNALYEIKADQTVVGPGMSFNVFNLTGPSRKIRLNRDIQFRLNGKISYAERRLGVYLRSGNGFYVGHLEDGAILGIWSQSLSLTPLHAGKHPGVFRNTFNPKSVPRAVDPVREEVHHLQAVLTNGNENGVEILSNPAPRIISDDGLHTSSHQAYVCRGKKRPKKFVEIAVAFSHRLCEQQGGYAATVASIEASITAASVPYDEQTCLSLIVSAVDGYCNPVGDPYASYESKFSGSKDAVQGLLPAFAEYWRKNMGDVPRDVVYFFPAFEDGALTAGVAYVGAACSQQFGYGWSEGLFPLVVAHEVGHNLNARHTESGLMTASGAVDSKEFSFSQVSVRQISDFIDGKNQSFGSDSSCITFASPTTETKPAPTPQLSEKPSLSPASSASSVPSPTMSLSSSPLPTPTPVSLPTSSSSPTASSTTNSPDSGEKPPVSSKSPEKTPSRNPVLPPSMTPEVSVAPSPSTKPSDSPSVVQSSTPSPTISTIKEGNCGSTFSRTEAFACDKTLKGLNPLQIVGDVGIIGSIRPSYAQQYGGFVLSILAQNVEIVSLAARVSLDRSLTVADIGKRVEYKDRREVEVRLGTSSIAWNGTESCCERDVFLYFVANIEANNNGAIYSGQVAVQYSTKVECFSCKGGFYEPSSLSVKCPKCSSKKAN